MLVMFGAMWLIVFLLYFPAIDANNSGEEEEVVRTRILFILTGFLYWWSWRSPGTNKPRQAIFWSLAIYPSCCVHCSIIYLVPCIMCDFWSSTLCILILKVCWTPCWCFAYLLPSMWTPLLMLCMLTLSMYAPPWPYPCCHLLSGMMINIMTLVWIILIMLSL